MYENIKQIFLSVGLPMIVSLITIFSKSFLDWKNKKNEIRNDLSQLLLKKRIDIYPKLWELVSNIYGVKKWNGIQRIDEWLKYHQNIRKNLREWRKKFWVFLSNSKQEIIYTPQDSFEKEVILISSLKALQKLEDALYLKLKYKNYDKTKIKRIDKYRNILLKSIRLDLDILEKSQKNLQI